MIQSIMQSSFVLVLAVSAVSLDTAMAFSNLRPTQRNLQTYTQYSDYSQKMLDAVNTERAKAGLSALCTNSKLAAAAKRHSEDMATKDYMAHKGSDGSSLSQRITQTGYEWDAVAENVASGQENVASVMESWMNSEGHRFNILGADYTMLGTAYAYSAHTTYKHYWTQNFGAGETEACDSGNSNSSQTSYPIQQQAVNDVVGEASVVQEAMYTTAPSTTTPVTPATPATPAYPVSEETPAKIVPPATTPTSAAENPVITEAPITTDAPINVADETKATGCKAKK